MCFAAALPLALMLGGSVATMFGNQAAQHAQEQTYQHERKRQQAMTAEQQSLFEDSLAKAGQLHDQGEQQKAIDTRQTALTSNVAPAGTAADYLPGSSSAPSVVKTQADNSAGAEKAFTSNLAAAMARMGAPNDQLLGTNIAIGRSAGQIGQIGTNKRMSADVLDAEMKAAANKGSTLRGLGSLASSIGGAMLGGGGGGIGAMLSGGGGAALNPILPTGAFGGLPVRSLAGAF